MKKKRLALGRFVPWLAVLLVAAWFLLSLYRMNAGQRREGVEQLENALRRSAVAHYGATGVYPPTLDELCGRYGVQIDETRYNVFYEIFAENIMPEITVLEK